MPFVGNFAKSFWLSIYKNLLYFYVAGNFELANMNTEITIGEIEGISQICEF